MTHPPIGAHPRRWRRLVVAGALPVALIAAACTGGQTDQKAATTPGKSAGTSIPSAASPAAAPAGAPAAKASPAASPAAKVAASPSPARVASPSPSPSPAAISRPITMTLVALNDSGQDGQATLTPQGNQTRVGLELRDSPAGPQPAHIHEGTCGDLNETPRYPLENVGNGRSETTVNVPVANLMNGNFAINVHRSPQDIPTYVSCGNIPALVTMRAQNNSGQDGTAILWDEGDGMVRVMLDLRNSPAGPQPAHIHEGTCANLNPAPRFPLENVANGRSESTIQADYTQLMNENFAINVHRSPQDIPTYVSCGNLPTAAAQAAASPSPSPAR
ncbi:MAG TPA: hypothetical protein VHL09_02790 [Dehalococcoidia bacterium]|nr:hypothetical protein [Dehalococcoidia bacterium]